MSFLNKVLQGFLGDKNAKDLKEIKKVVDKIKKVEPAIAELSDDELRAKTQEFKDKIDAAIYFIPEIANDYYENKKENLIIWTVYGWINNEDQIELL